MEQFIKDTIEEFGQDIRNSLSIAIGKVYAKAYNKGFEACKKAYHIDDAKFLKEQEEIETKYMGSYKTTASTDNGRKYKDYSKEDRV